MNTSSFLSTVFTSWALPLANTMSQAITSTTPVRMAVPRLDSTPDMPILARMLVAEANTADSTA